MMARLPDTRRPPLDVGVLVELGTLMRTHWARLTPGEREHVLALLRKSRGRPHWLTRGERADIQRLVAKLDVLAFGRAARPLARRLRAR